MDEEYLACIEEKKENKSQLRPRDQRKPTGAYLTNPPVVFYLLNRLQTPPWGVNTGQNERSIEPQGPDHCKGWTAVDYPGAHRHLSTLTTAVPRPSARTVVPEGSPLLLEGALLPAWEARVVRVLKTPGNLESTCNWHHTNLSFTGWLTSVSIMS